MKQPISIDTEFRCDICKKALKSQTGVTIHKQMFHPNGETEPELPKRKRKVVEQDKDKKKAELQQEISELLSQYDEFKNINPKSIEAKLIASALIALDTPGSKQVQDNARKFIKEAADRHAADSSDTVTISFIEQARTEPDPVLDGDL